jgi:hypothetical protein
MIGATALCVICWVRIAMDMRRRPVAADKALQKPVDQSLPPAR